MTPSTPERPEEEHQSGLKNEHQSGLKNDAPLKFIGGKCRSPLAKSLVSTDGAFLLDMR